MNLSDAFQVVESLSANDANHKIQSGWTLLAVVTTSHPNGELHPCYVLGKAKHAETTSSAQQST
ncbi:MULTISPECIES: hypothetical protein [Pseudomonas]|jgi:hypothetical protein|uniref:Uncharacterized protein n=1 Tax=Pseudomonas syringae TaxID=317 RepID=A0A085VA28_PSESX|nr:MULTISPECIES: hypothetical protein [Pseudomonas]EPJ80075.1 hypothetical protein CFII64_19508 [Pseudomonas sp. CFII64]KFE52291.1 hypothetical protein IV02_09920 [Pseudomonas syringae]